MIFMISRAAAAGILSDVRDDVRSSSSSSSSDDHDDHDDHDHCHHDCYDDYDYDYDYHCSSARDRRPPKKSYCDDCGKFLRPKPYPLFEGLAEVIKVPFGSLLNEDYVYRFPKFPYYDGHGYQNSVYVPQIDEYMDVETMRELMGMDVEPVVAEEEEFIVTDFSQPSTELPVPSVADQFQPEVDRFEPVVDCYTDEYRETASRLTVEYATDMYYVSRYGVHVLASSAQGLGIEAEFSYLQENRPDEPEDHLWLGDVNVIFRCFQRRRVQWRWGLGVNWLESGRQLDWGVNLTVSADFFIARPFILSTGFDWGTIGEAGFFQYRATAGVNFRHLEAYVGYQYLDIGSTQANFLLSGLRFWW